jgi:hypothetical protein
VKLLITYLQIIVSLPSLLRVVYPEPYLGLVNSFTWLNLSFFGNIGLSCSFHFDYVTEMVVTTLVPIGVTLTLLTCYLLQLRVRCSMLVWYNVNSRIQ